MTYQNLVSALIKAYLVLFSQVAALKQQLADRDNTIANDKAKIVELTAGFNDAEIKIADLETANKEANSNLEISRAEAIESMKVAEAKAVEAEAANQALNDLKAIENASAEQIAEVLKTTGVEIPSVEPTPAPTPMEPVVEPLPEIVSGEPQTEMVSIPVAEEKQPDWATPPAPTPMEPVVEPQIDSPANV